MKRIRAAVFGVALTSIFTTGIAQTVTTLRLDGQPLVYMKDGRPHGCGLRIFGFHEIQPSGRLRMVDVSVNVHTATPASVKLTTADTSFDDMKAGNKPRSARVLAGWIRAQDAISTRPLEGKTAAGDDGLSLLYWTDHDSALAVFAAQAERKTIMIGVRRDGDSHERIYAGHVNLSLDESKQITQCLSELSAGLRPRK